MLAIKSDMQGRREILLLVLGMADIRSPAGVTLRGVALRGRRKFAETRILRERTPGSRAIAGELKHTLSEAVTRSYQETGGHKPRGLT